VSPRSPARAIVFAYHNVGVRCLAALLDAGIDVRLVVTHEDGPGEAIWFASVAQLAAGHGIRTITPADANTPEVMAACRAAEPDFLFSFYYRKMLRAPLLALAKRGAFNLHGSLLPRYRGRAPVNWAVLHGERETGASLHVMDERPDHGDLVDQCAVPILGDDTAREVFDKVTVAAEIVVARSVPKLVDGSAVFMPQDFSRGSYFGGRRPEDGRIPADASAQRIHDLVRAVAPPEYPGAFFDAAGVRILIGRTRVRGSGLGASPGFSLFARDDALWLRAADGGLLEVPAAHIDGQPLDAPAFEQRFGADAALTPSPKG
jgi:methionyl-tRNA formyltransferase